MERIILYLDMDAFFAQIEERENPRFKGKPVVVGADPKSGQGRGVVSTCNYQARRYGIHSALPISKAFELCSEAIFLPVNMKLYQKVSEKIMEIIKKYLPSSMPSESKGLLRGSPIFEQVSLDEAYLDLSFLIPNLIPKTKPQQSYSLKTRSLKLRVDIEKGYQRAENLAKKLKKEIFEKEKLTSTVGIGPNKLIAKMAAEKAKPNGLLVIKPNQVKKFLEPLDIEDLPGIGPKTAEKLRTIKINKINELKRLLKSKLKNMFGKIGETIYERARGIDEEEVTSEEIIKSIGKEHTFEKDTRDPEIIFGTFENIIKDVWQELIENKFSFKTITVICRYQGFETHTKSRTLEKSTKDLTILSKEAKKLLLKFLLESKKLIRLIGLRVKIC